MALSSKESDRVVRRLAVLGIPDRGTRSWRRGLEDLSCVAGTRLAATDRATKAASKNVRLSLRLPVRAGCSPCDRGGTAGRRGEAAITAMPLT
ncbi:hypothetical protein [Kibdelosporangium philippinense]|uniref:hypothetical protein n=1 Tax=Kibdelosporangium philippinense TaxID=211113 RepID=UPI003615CE75